MIVPARQLASAAGVPEHVAVIMDGNGRWAKNRSLPRRIGHRYGITPVRTTVEYCANLGVRYLTLFAFSSENWGRPREEVNSLMSLFVDALNREVAELDARNIRLRFMGENRRLGPALREAMRVAEIRTRANTSLELTVAVAYGGRADLVNAARKLARQAAAGKLDPEQIDMDRFAGELEMAQIPDVDLLIRTGGDRRVSNFLLWSLAYSELYFSNVLWPDFTAGELDSAFGFYRSRQRRFGHTSEQVEAGAC